MDELVTCEYCGNVWDGNAQCNCYESMIESDEQIMGLVPPSNHNSVETAVDTGNKKKKPIGKRTKFDTHAAYSGNNIPSLAHFKLKILRK